MVKIVNDTLKCEDSMPIANGYSRLTADVPEQVRDLLRATALMKRISLRTLVTRYLVEGLKREGQIVKIEQFIAFIED